MQLGEQFLKKIGLEHVQLLTADGALEAAPAVILFLSLESYLCMSVHNSIIAFYLFNE